MAGDAFLCGSCRPEGTVWFSPMGDARLGLMAACALGTWGRGEVIAFMALIARQHLALHMHLVHVALSHPMPAIGHG